MKMLITRTRPSRDRFVMTAKLARTPAQSRADAARCGDTAESCTDPIEDRHDALSRRWLIAGPLLLIPAPLQSAAFAPPARPRRVR